MQKTNSRRDLWRKRYQEFKQGGLSRAAYCKKHRIANSTLNYWFNQVRKLEKNQMLVEVKPASVSRTEGHVAVIVAGSYRVEVDGCFDAELFTGVIKALESLQ
jgi:hypothetical protein